MENQEKGKAGKVISVIMILVLVVAVAFLFYQNTQNKLEVETKLNELKTEMNEIKEQENALKNELESNQVANEVENTTTSEETEPMSEKDYIASGKWKLFQFSTPVGETGTFEVYAEKAAQASGFSGASAHIYYLRAGELYYHNVAEKDVKLATGITDLKTQGEDVVAVKGANAKILVKNSYIEYQ